MQPARSVGLNISPVKDLSNLNLDSGPTSSTLAVGLRTVHGVYLDLKWHADICVTSIEVMAFIQQPVAIKATGHTNDGAIIMLWNEDGLEVGKVATHKFGVERIVRDLVKKFAMDWVLDNKPKERGRR